MSYDNPRTGDGFEQTYPQYAVGMHEWGGDRADVILLHDSPPDQEEISVALLDSFICCEKGKVITIQRHQFSLGCTQEDL